MRKTWLIAPLMLCFAALACDGDSSYVPPQVQDVRADSQTPGRAYARVDGSHIAPTVYGSDNYGRTWRRSRIAWGPDYSSYSLQMVGESLVLGGSTEPLWAYPARPVFRYFFWPNVSLGLSLAPYFFRLPTGQVSNSVQGDTLYIAMGTEGVLVGPAPGRPRTRDWELTASGLDALRPMPLKATNLGQIIGITLAGLAIPPLVLIHSFVLNRVWLYALWPSDARRWAFRTALVITAFAAIAIFIWLTDIRIDYYPIVGVMTLITACVGFGAAMIIAAQRGVSPANRIRLGGATIPVSLLVSAGVAGIWVTWPLVYAVVFGYWAFQRNYRKRLGKYLDFLREPFNQWLIDRLALESMSFTILSGLIVWVVLAVIFRLPLHGYALGLIALSVCLGAGLSILFMPARIAQRLASQNDVTAFDPEVSSDLIRAARTDVGLSIVFWLVLTVAASAITFVAQVAVGMWFQGLLR